METSADSNTLDLIISRLDKLKTPQLAMLVLKLYGKLTRVKQIEILKQWGKKEADNLSGGNYSRDLVRSGFVHEVGKGGKEKIFALTGKGKLEADRILAELRKGGVNGRHKDNN